jgi:hypothetical protein
MLLIPSLADPLDRLAQRIHLAAAPDRILLREIMTSGGLRLHALMTATGARRLESLLDAGAWTEAAFTLVELEFPTWSMRRLVLDDGMWFCSLSLSPALPAEFDEIAEASHESMPLAILAALIEARRATDAARASRSLPRPTRGDPQSDVHRINCDNFS